MRTRCDWSLPRPSPCSRSACVLGWRLRRGVVEHDHDGTPATAGAGRPPSPAGPTCARGSAARPPSLASSGPDRARVPRSTRPPAREGCLDVVTLHVPDAWRRHAARVRRRVPRPGAGAVPRRRPADRDRRPRERVPRGERRARAEHRPVACEDKPVDLHRQPLARLRRATTTCRSCASCPTTRRRRSGTVNWVIGLDSVRPFRVDRGREPAAGHGADRLTARAQVRSSTMLPNTASAASRS